MSYGALDTGWQSSYAGDGEIEFDELEVKVGDGWTTIVFGGVAFFERHVLKYIELEGTQGDGKKFWIDLHDGLPVHSFEHALFLRLKSTIEEQYQSKTEELAA